MTACLVRQRVYTPEKEMEKELLTYNLISSTSPVTTGLLTYYLADKTTCRLPVVKLINTSPGYALVDSFKQHRGFHIPETLSVIASLYLGLNLSNLLLS